MFLVRWIYAQRGSSSSCSCKTPAAAVGEQAAADATLACELLEGELRLFPDRALRESFTVNASKPLEQAAFNWIFDEDRVVGFQMPVKLATGVRAARARAGAAEGAFARPRSWGELHCQRQQALEEATFNWTFDEDANRVIGVQTPVKLATCTACQEAHPQAGTAKGSCGHDYCRNCLEHLFQQSLRNATLYPPRCCRRAIPLDTARKVISDALATNFPNRKKEMETRRRTYCYRSVSSARSSSLRARSRKPRRVSSLLGVDLRSLQGKTPFWRLFPGPQALSLIHI